jgi:hypothetical protein
MNTAYAQHPEKNAGPIRARCADKSRVLFCIFLFRLLLILQFRSHLIT